MSLKKYISRLFEIGTKIGIMSSLLFSLFGTMYLPVYADSASFSTSTTTDPQSLILPAISSLNVSSEDSSGSITSGTSIIDISFTTNKPITNATLTVAGHLVPVNGSGMGLFIASYSAVGGDVGNPLNASLSLIDVSGNVGRASFSLNSLNNPNGLISNASSTMPTTVPVIPISTPIAQSSLSPILLSTPEPLSLSAPSVPITPISSTAPIVSLAPATPIPSDTPISYPVVSQSAPQGSQSLIYQFTHTLKLHSTGIDVTELQKRLFAEGVYQGPVTGYFGPLTKAGVKEYQNKYKLKSTGMVNKATRNNLNKNT